MEACLNFAGSEDIILTRINNALSYCNEKFSKTKKISIYSLN